MVAEETLFVLRNNTASLPYRHMSTQYYCVIGHPIAHSQSPALHEAGFQEFQIDAHFTAEDVDPAVFGDWMRDTFRPTYRGAAVTAPHKELVLQHVDALTEAAQKVGAANTLFWKGDQLCGTTTDGIGALRAIMPYIPSVAGAKILLLGAGGAARAIVYALAAAGADITIWNRTPQKAHALAKSFDVRSVDTLEQLDPEAFDLIVNATSVGLNTWKSVLPEDFWRPNHVGFDIVYSPLETKFLSDCAEAGGTTISGDKMLVEQALEQFKLWHGVELEREVMEQAFFMSGAGQ